MLYDVVYGGCGLVLLKYVFDYVKRFCPLRWNNPSDGESLCLLFRFYE